MKKMITIMLALVMIFAFAGCGGSSDPYGGTYKAVSSEDLAVIEESIEGWTNAAEWNKAKATMSMNTKATFMGETETEKSTGTMYFDFVNDISVSKTKMGSTTTEEYTVDGITYVKETTSEGTEKYSYEAFDEEDIGSIDYFFSQIDAGSLSDFTVTATATSGARNIKIAFNEFPEELMPFGFDTNEEGEGEGEEESPFDFSLAMILRIDANNKLIGVKVLMEMSMEMEGLMTLDMKMEMTVAPYSGEITLPDDLNETNYPLMGGWDF